MNLKKKYSEEELENMKQKIIASFEKNKISQPLQDGLAYLDASKNAKNIKHEAHAFYIIARSQYMVGNLQKAIKYFEKALDIYHNIELNKNLVSSYIAIAACQSELENYDESIQNYQKALAFDDEDVINKATILNNIGAQFKKTNKYLTALEYFEKSNAALNPKIELHKSLYCQSMNNIASIHFLTGEHSKALSTYRYVHDMALKEKFQYITCKSLVGIAKCLLQEGKHNLAEKALKESIACAEKYGLKMQYVDAQLVLIQYMLHLDIIKKIETKLVDCYSVALNFYPTAIKEVLRLMVQFYTKTNNKELSQIFELELKKTEHLSKEKLLALIDYQ